MDSPNFSCTGKGTRKDEAAKSILWTRERKPNPGRVMSVANEEKRVIVCVWQKKRTKGGGVRKMTSDQLVGGGALLEADHEGILGKDRRVVNHEKVNPSKGGGGGGGRILSNSAKRGARGM